MIIGLSALKRLSTIILAVKVTICIDYIKQEHQVPASGMAAYHTVSNHHYYDKLAL